MEKRQKLMKCMGELKAGFKGNRWVVCQVVEQYRVDNKGFGGLDE